MEKIIIEVSESVANKWKELEEEKQKEINALIGKIISQSVESKKVDFWKRLREIRKSADEKGFSDEILNQMLNED